MALGVMYVAFRSYADKPGLHVAGLVAMEGLLVTVIFGIIRCNSGGRWQELDLLTGGVLSALLAGLIVRILPKFSRSSAAL